MNTIIKSKKDAFVAVIILEVIFYLIFQTYSLPYNTDFGAIFTGCQFIIIALLLMPDFKYGVGDTLGNTIRNFDAYQKEWDTMTPAEQSKVSNAAWHESNKGILYFASLLLVMFFVFVVWIPFVYPLIITSVT